MTVSSVNHQHCCSSPAGNHLYELCPSAGAPLFSCLVQVLKVTPSLKKKKNQSFFSLLPRRRWNYTFHLSFTNFKSAPLWRSPVCSLLSSWWFDALSLLLGGFPNNLDFGNNLCLQRSLQAFSKVAEWTKTLAALVKKKKKKNMARPLCRPFEPSRSHF